MTRSLLLLLLTLALPCRAEDDLTVVFRLEAPGARRVCVAGEFNAWAPDAWPLTKGDDGAFTREARLRAGVYRYKFVVDGEWTHDPANPSRDPDGHRNSVLVVGDAPAPDLSPRAPRPRLAREGAFVVVPASELAAPPNGIAPRPLYVYLPPSYERARDRRYPVVYAHDGQNIWSEDGICFGHGGWYLDQALDRLWAAGQAEEALLVGVPSSEARMREYGAPREYERFLIDVVKPAIDARFRTRAGPESTMLLGSSMGGLVSFTLALSRPDVFGAAACLSSSFWYSPEGGTSAFDLLRARGKQPVRLYLDSGTAGAGQDGAPDTRRMRDALLAAGWRDLEHHEAEGATHDERAWRARAERPLRFLLRQE
jgi:enterochelin esterase-like enzyme